MARLKEKYEKEQLDKIAKKYRQNNDKLFLSENLFVYFMIKKNYVNF